MVGMKYDSQVLLLTDLFLLTSEMPNAPAHILKPIAAFTGVPCSYYLQVQPPTQFSKISICSYLNFFLFISVSS